MSRLGLAPGADADAVLDLKFRSGALTTDDSGNAQTCALNGTGQFQPKYAAGYFDDGIQFEIDGDGNKGKNIEVTGSGTLDFAGAFTIDAHIFVEETVAATSISIAYRTDIGGGENDSLKLRITPTNRELEFTVWDSSQVSLTLTSPVDSIQMNRWTHIRAVNDPSAFLSLFIDGQLVAKRTNTLADVDTASLPVLRIGTFDGTDRFTGKMSEFRIRAIADTDPTSCAPNVRAERITNRRIKCRHIDLKEFLHDESFTGDAGSFYLAAADIDLSGFIYDQNDIIAVRGKAVVDSSITTLTGVGNDTDIKDAGTTDSYFWDVNAQQFHLAEDPSSSYDEFLEIVVRYRCSDLGVDVGGRYYRASLLSADDGERNTAFFFQPYPTGGGASLGLATNHEDHPTGWTSEEATSIIWTGSDVRSFQISDHLPWAEAAILFTGYVEVQPERTPDVITVQTVSQYAKLHRISVGGAALNATDFPSAPEFGHPWPAIWGRGHKRIRAPWTGNSASVGGSTVYEFKVTDHKITRLRNAWADIGVQMVNVDLSDATFFCYINPLARDVYVDVDGYGTAADATSPVDEYVEAWGDRNDTIVLPEATLQEWLTFYGNVPVADVADASWADTGSRVEIARRLAEPLGGQGAFITEMQRWGAETLTFLYQLAAGGYGWKDVDKAASIDWTLTDADIIEDQGWIADYTQLAKRAEASAYMYQTNFRNESTLGRVSTLDLKADARYDQQAVWYPPPSSNAEDLTRIAHGGSLDTLMGIWREFLENVGKMHQVRVGQRFATAELLDVVDHQGSARVSGEGNRFRVLRAKPEADGSTSLVLFPERLFPADGTSAPETRAAWGPMRHLDYGDEDGTTLANDSGWQPISDHEYLFQGDIAEFATAITQRFATYAQRTGGGADTDLQIRIYDLTNSLALASVDVGTSAAFDNTTTFANIPTTDARLRLEYKTTNGASGELWAAVWESMETGAEVGDPVGPTTLYQDGDSGGWSCPARGRGGYLPQTHLQYGDNTPKALADSAAWAVVDDHETIFQGSLKQFPTTVIHRFAVYATRSGGTDVEFRIQDVTNTQTLATITTIGGAAFYTTASFSNIPAGDARIQLQYRTTGGATATINSARWESDEGDPPVDDDVVATTLLTFGKASGTGALAVVGADTVVAGFKPQAFGINDFSNHILAETVLRCVMYCDPGGSTDFRPSLIYWDSDGDPHYLAYFAPLDGAIAGFYEATIYDPSWDPHNYSMVTLSYYSPDGSPIIYSCTLDLQPVDNGKSRWNVPGARALETHRNFVPGETRMRWAIYLDATGTTNFRPVILGENDGIAVDFGVVAASAGIVTAEGVPSWTKARLGYTSDGGTATIYSISLFAIYPEIEDD